MDMLMADSRPCLDTCPRCGSGGLEKLRTHSHCANCNYFEAKESSSIESVLFKLDRVSELLEEKESLKKSNKKDQPAA